MREDCSEANSRSRNAAKAETCKIYIASDHGGFELKSELIRFLNKRGHATEDLGSHSPNPDDDYPDFALTLSKKVSREDGRGILVCRTGAGMCMAANKVSGVYAAVCLEKESATFARKHQNCNVLCLGTKWVSGKKAEEIVDTWLATRFEGGRHERRLKKIKEIERTYTDGYDGQ